MMGFTLKCLPMTAVLLPAVLLLSLTASALPNAAAKNVILMISDGCGFNQVDAASCYQYGKTGKQIYEQFPFKYAVSTYANGGSYDPAQAWGSFTYVNTNPTDSAAAATALSTGYKTNNGSLGVGPAGNNLKHMIERAEELGKVTGVVTSVEISHATPAGFVAHEADRGDYTIISTWMLTESAVDVIMGCGHPWYNNSGQSVTTPNSYQYVGGSATWNGLVAGTVGADADGDGTADPWTLIQTRAQFQAMATGTTPERVCGVAQVYETLQQRRGGTATAAPYVVPLTTTVPTLAEMVKAALNVLDNDPDGLLLMIEGGAVDWAGHSNQSGRVIEEEIDFNRAVEAVVDWVNQHSNWNETLLIVTGDHETGYLTGPGSNPGWNPIVNNGAGNLPGMQWNSGSHTNSLLPLYAKGAAARLLALYADECDQRRGRYLDNIEIGKLVFDVLK